MNKKRLVILSMASIIIIVIIVFIVGQSFSFFRYAKSGNTDISLAISGIEVSILNEENNSLNIENTYPISDSEGMSLTPFEFSMTNTANISLNYSIKIVSDETKLKSCKLSDKTSCPALSTDYIKFSYKKNDGTYSEPQILSSNNGIVASGVITSKETITSSIIIWIDDSAGNEIQNHYFFGKIIIYGEQAIDSQS